LSRDEFYLALKLIAYAQNGIPPTEESVLAKVEVPFPQFKSDSSKPGMGMGMGMPNPAAAPRGPTLADMNQLNVMALSQSSGNSLIPGMDEHMKQREVEKAQEKMMSNSNSPWFMRPEDVQKYNSIFEYFNKSHTGVLSFEEAKDAFMQTQLEEDVLEQIWSMTDTEEAGEFDRKMF
jgi:Cytoskeletal-regulatory complex EF hand